MSDSSKESDSYNESGSDSEDRLPEINQIDMGIPINANTKILVTGGNGYLGSHIVYYLLEMGVSVKVSVHDLENEIGYSHLEELPKAAGRLEIVEAELTDKEVWREVVKGCHAIIHTASPNPFKAPKQELEVIYPAVEGTLAILHAAKEHGIKRFILTSSIAAMRGGKYKLTYNEDSWGEPENITGIEKSKIFSERSAWFFTKENRQDIQLTVVNPGFLLGPCLQNHYEFSSGLFLKKFMDGRVSSLLKMHVPVVDVRDAALAHVKLLWNPASIGHRYICVEGSHWFESFSSILSREFATDGFEFPTKTISKFPLKLISFFDSGVKTMLPFYGKEIYFSNEKIKTQLTGFVFRNFDETLIDMGYCFIKKKFVTKVSAAQKEENDDEEEEQNINA